MTTKRIILAAGHRNTDRGGAWKGPESAWTYPICKAVEKEYERRGGQALVMQEFDGDNDPSDSNRLGLQGVAYLAADKATKLGGVDAVLFMHYGAEPLNGFFAIYPDSTNLSPNSTTDVRGNNTLDIRLARTMAAHVKKTGMPIRGDGTMSETRSGVGIAGWRLGELHGTRALQPTTPRLVMEAGNSLDPEEYALMWDTAWQAKYASAVVDALEEIFGPLGNATVTPPASKPEVDPNKDKPRTFTARFETPVREAPGFYNYEESKANPEKFRIPAGTKGKVIDGPKVREGFEWYDLEVAGKGTGWAPIRIVQTLEIEG